MQYFPFPSSDCVEEILKVRPLHTTFSISSQIGFRLLVLAEEDIARALRFRSHRHISLGSIEENARGLSRLVIAEPPADFADQLWPAAKFISGKKGVWGLPLVMITKTS